MIKPNEIQQLILDRYIKKINQQKELSITISNVAEKEIDYFLQKSELKNKYTFNIMLSTFINVGDDGIEVAITRDKEVLTNGANLLEEKLKLFGWKNVKIKVYNLWWPLTPRVKVSIER